MRITPIRGHQETVLPCTACGRSAGPPRWTNRAPALAVGMAACGCALDTSGDGAAMRDSRRDGDEAWTGTALSTMA